MKTYFQISLSILVGLLGLQGCGQQNEQFRAEVAAFQDEKNAMFSDSTKSPLPPEKLEIFEGLPFYPASEKFYVHAKFEPLELPVVEFPTTTERMARYRPFGKLYFDLGGESFELTVFEPIAFPSNGKDAAPTPLFVPYTDLTNGDGSYGGGRYIDLERQQGSEWIIDFNRSYNPYCAYNDRYSCPIPPPENHLESRIEAGVMYTSDH